MRTTWSPGFSRSAVRSAGVGAASFTFRDRTWPRSGAPDRIEAAQRLDGLVVAHERPAPRLTDNELLALRHAQRLAQRAQAYAELAIEVDLAGEGGARLSAPVLDSL